MKKSFYLAFLFIVLASIGFSQSQRLVLLEHFTQASCGPCATYNPSIHSLLVSNPDKITSINYHTSWPGTDPMYNHNTTENGARTGYYGVNSVPNSVLDGNVYNGHPNGWSINTVNTRYAVPSPFEIYLHHELSADESVLTVTMLIYATEDVGAGMRAQIAVIEEHIHFNNPPGSNGETDFYNVMKKMLPNQTGTILPAFQSGDYMILQYSWEHQNVYDVDQLAAVGFVQNNDSKEVHQAANSSDELFDPLFATDAEVTKTVNVAQSLCIGNVQPKITIRNNGSNELTSLDISYTMNNGEPQTIAWTGSLGFLETEDIMLPENNFTIESMNILEVSLTNPNGMDDDYGANNTMILEIPEAYEANPPITLILKLDNHPEETTWEFTNYNGDVIHAGGPYSTPGQNIVQQFPFETTDCYTFTIYDAGGDGLTGGGSFAVGFGASIIAQGNTFGEKASGQFNILYTGTNPDVSNAAFQLYPNPVSENATISLQIDEPSVVQVSVYNTTGKLMYQTDPKSYNAGNQNLYFSREELNSGVYFIQVSIDDQVYTQKVILR
jgi:hypothetical protein